jgi:hypothetical protein
MKKYIFTMSVLFILLLSISSFNPSISAQRPDYEKYGRIAIAVVKEDFPGDEVQDYEYMGRKQLNNNQVMDSFQFKLTENGKPILATVQITHNLKDNKLLSLTVTEEPQR